MDWLQPVVTILSLLTALLAWGAKLMWGKEFAAAKDETIRAKEAQIAALESQISNLQELTPMKIREYFESIKTQLEEWNDALQQQLNAAKTEIKHRNEQLETLRTEGASRGAEVAKLRGEKASLEASVTNLEDQLQKLKKEAITFELPTLDIELIRRTATSATNITRWLPPSEVRLKVPSTWSDWSEFKWWSSDAPLTKTPEEETANLGKSPKREGSVESPPQGGGRATPERQAGAVVQPQKGRAVEAASLALPPSQQADVTRVIQEAGLNPGDFTWAVQPSRRALIGPLISALVHTPTGCFFRFEFTEDASGQKRVSVFTPGEGAHEVTKAAGSWEDQLGHIRMWLKSLQPHRG